MTEAEQLGIVRRWISTLKRRGSASKELAEELEELLGWRHE